MANIDAHALAAKLAVVEDVGSRLTPNSCNDIFVCDCSQILGEIRLQHYKKLVPNEAARFIQSW